MRPELLSPLTSSSDFQSDILHNTVNKNIKVYKIFFKKSLLLHNHRLEFPSMFHEVARGEFGKSVILAAQEHSVEGCGEALHYVGRVCRVDRPERVGD
jgi:hypothetical protein